MRNRHRRSHPRLRRRHLLAVVAALAVATVLSPRLTRQSGLVLAPKNATAKAPLPVPSRSVEPPPGEFGRTTLRRSPRQPRHATRIVVGFSPDATRRQKQAAVARAGGTVERSIGTLDATVVDVPDDKIAQAVGQLDQASSVAYAEADAPVEATAVVAPNDMLWPNQWGLRLIGLEAAWPVVSGASPVVAVLDTGADLTHPDLNGAFVPGQDLVNGDADPTDDNGHGTAVAGVLAARAGNGEGGAGVCPSCTVMPVKVLGANGGGLDSTVAAGIVWATDHGARVINMSLGGPQSSQVLADAVAYAVSKGVVLIAAAGNSGTTTQFYPAAYPGVVSVAATNSSDVLYDWSNRGPWVSVAAPGCNTAPARGGSYENFCGTSSATPVVAGLAGLALASRPQASIAEVDNALMSGVAVASVEHGRVDATRMLAALGVSAPTPVTRPPVTSVVASWSVRLGRAGARTSRVVPAGPLAVNVSASVRTPVSLSIISPVGRTVTTARGKAPLSISRTLAAGRYSFVLRGANGVAVTLRLLHRTPAVIG